MSTILAFTSPQVQRLTSLSARMLAYWEETDVYSSSYEDKRPRRPYRRIYTFNDVVSLRTLVTLRRTYNVKLDELRKTGQYLHTFSDDPWKRQFWVQSGRVLFQHPESPDIVDHAGQVTFVVKIDQIKRQLEIETQNWNERELADIGKIARHRHVQHNQWVLKGTRIPTSAIWSFHVAGFDLPGIIREYPSLTPQDIEAALEHERKKHIRAA